MKEICGEIQVEGLELQNLKTGEKKKLPVSGVFVAVGQERESLQPETAGQRKSASLRRQRQMEQWLHLRHANILRND